MYILFVYIAILVVAAVLTYLGFGDASKLVSPGCGLDFFHAEGDDTKVADSKRKLFGPNSKLLEKHGGVPTQQRHMLSFLEDNCCALPVRAKDVAVLRHPTEFYESLTAHIRRAQKSIVISALYVGDGPLSRAFVACLEDKVAEVSARQRMLPASEVEPFSITILLDYNRMQDRRNLVTVKRLLTLAHTTESAVALDAAADGAEPPLSVRLYLFQNSCRWNALFAPVSRCKEALGVQHTKIFSFDGEHTILSGANLSDDYFSTRMDRYVVLSHNEHVAWWYSQLVFTLTAISHQVVCRSSFVAHFGEDELIEETSPLKNLFSAKNNNNSNGSIFHNANHNNNNNHRRSPHGSPTLHRKSDLVILPNALGVDPSSEADIFAARTGSLLQDFSRRVTKKFKDTAYTCFLEQHGAAEKGSGCDSVLFPTVQFGRAGVYHDSQVVEGLLASATAEDRVFLASPYMNVYADFLNRFLYGKFSVDCITASVSTNGWSGQKGMAGYIPYFYLQLERVFFFLMKAYDCLHRVRVHEFSAEGFTYHAKGLWFTGGGSKAVSTTDSNASNGSSALAISPDAVPAPYLVAYGSTNYGYRSVHKDVEAECFLFTFDDALRASIRAELVFLLQQSATVTEDRFVGKAMGRFQPVVSVVAQLGQDFL